MAYLYSKDNYFFFSPPKTTTAELKLFSCYDCELTTHHKSNLIDHMTRLHPLKFSCTQCDKTYKKRENLIEHVIECHPDLAMSVTSNNVYECNQCTFTTTTEDDWHRHTLTHSSSRLVIYTECDGADQTQPGLVIQDSMEFVNDHIVQEDSSSVESVSCQIQEPNYNDTSNYVTCPHCNARYKFRRTLDDHLVKNHPNSFQAVSTKVFECEICIYKTTKSKTYLYEHCLQKHPDFPELVTSKIYDCKHCSFKTTLKHILPKHELKHSKEARYACLCCKNIYATKTSLDDHMVKNHPDSAASVTKEIHECSMCSFKTARSRRMLEDHILRKHPDSARPISSSEILECEHCSFKTVFKNKLFSHASKHKTTPIMYPCLQCNCTYKTKNQLDDHVVKNHPHSMESVTSIIQECGMCEFKTTRGKSQLDEHVLRKHPDSTESVTTKTFLCTMCNYRTTIRDHLSSHALTHAKKEIRKNSFKCGHCNRSCKTKQSLNTHITNKHLKSASKETHQCPECDFNTTKMKIWLEDHILQSHPDCTGSVTNQIYLCRHCPYRTTIKLRWTIHKRKHPETVADNLKCLRCNKSYKKRHALDEHMVKKHPNTIASVATKLRTCEMCTFKTTKGKVDLDNHILKQHSDTIESVTSEVFACPKCNFKTTKRIYLTRHMLIHRDV
nr:unnamed protein product [Callosobruchus analis]